VDALPAILDVAPPPGVAVTTDKISKVDLAPRTSRSPLCGAEETSIAASIDQVAVKAVNGGEPTTVSIINLLPTAPVILAAIEILADGDKEGAIVDRAVGV
jgi:hypothetical protein